MRILSHRFTRVVVVLGVFTTIGFNTTACRPEPRACPTGPVHPGLAIAAGDRANSPKPSWPAELDGDLQAILDATEAGSGDRGVTLVRVDGSPTIGCVLTYDASARNPDAKEHARKEFGAAVRARTTELGAAVPEADPLTALSLAGAAAGPGGTVALIDSGLQTVPPLDFRADNLLDRNIDTVVAALAEGGHLPDLRDRKVILSGIGYTAPRQERLGEGQRARLIELWQKIAVAAGAKDVMAVLRPNGTAPDGDLPTVSEVPMPKGGLVFGCGLEIPFANTGPVGFRSDSTDFRDEAAARATLAHITAWLRDNARARATVTGSVAHYGADSTGGLSLGRATRVRDVLVALGARADQLVAQGAGWGPFPSKTAPPDDLSDPLNRRVIVHMTCS